MNKLPAKQTYLLLIAIFGIIAASIYSTYAIFTLDTQSDNIVSIRTPDALYIPSSSYEYKQLTVPKNAYITTDIDIYNNFDYELCYNVWYKVVSSSLDNNIKVYENTESSLTTSATIGSVASKRISLIIINDNNTDAKVNIGVVYMKNEGTCELNISKDRNLISTTINAKLLSDSIIENAKVTNSDEGYLTYKDNTNELVLSEEKTYYVSNDFNYQNEIFTLKEPKELTKNELVNYNSYYLCENDSTCNTLYHMTEINSEKYAITKYDILIGYLAGENGLRKVEENYYYYGDNPNNFIYYNCTNELDTKTCELWRIIGFYYDKDANKYLTKIIKNDYLSDSEFADGTNLWPNSNIKKYLNDEYKLKNDMSEEFTFKQENIIDIDKKISEISFLNEENKAQIMLMNVSDYLNTSICKKDKISEYQETCLSNNWLNKNTNEMTMTTKYLEPYLDEETNETITPDNNTIYSVGSSIQESNIGDSLSIRPVIYLKHRVLLTSGDGSLENPYIIR